MSEETQSYKVTNLVGTPTDYSNERNWAHLPKCADKDVDTFFVYPTLYIDPRPGAPDLAAVDDTEHRAAVKAHFKSAPLVFEDSTNVYEPYYRQSNLCAMIGQDPKSAKAFQVREQRTDIYAALDYFFEHYNQGRPYILAGHSQGSLMLKIALCDYFREHVDYLDRMVATYAIGFSITTDDLATNSALKFAERADDTGVIVSWNTEGPENKRERSVVVMKNALSINPINWRRDDTYAPASENLGDKLPIYDGGGMFASEFLCNRPGLADARVDVEKGVVVCTTLAKWYVPQLVPGAPGPFGPASLHLSDYPAYWENIKDNVRTRIQAYFARA